MNETTRGSKWQNSAGIKEINFRGGLKEYGNVPPEDLAF